MSITCRNCGLSLNADDAFCGNCGQPAAADKPATVPGTAGRVAEGRDAAAPMSAVGNAQASAGAPEDYAHIGAAETAWQPRTFSSADDSATRQGFGQGRPGGAAHEAQGQPQHNPGHAREAGTPRQVTAGYTAPSQNGASSKGFLGSLFDFRFTSFVTPTVVKVLYVLIMIVLGLTALGFAVSAFEVNKMAGIFVLIVVAPLFFLVSLALYRIVLELFVVIFQIAADLRTIRERGDSR
jgi:hypothetical protein